MTSGGQGRSGVIGAPRGEPAFQRSARFGRGSPSGRGSRYARRTDMRRLHRSIFYWEAKRRFHLLIAFRKRVVDYFTKATWDNHRGVRDGPSPESGRRVGRPVDTPWA